VGEVYMIRYKWAPVPTAFCVLWLWMNGNCACTEYAVMDSWHGVAIKLTGWAMGPQLL